MAHPEFMIPLAEEINLDRLIDEVGATAQPLMGKNSNKLSIERGRNGNIYQSLWLPPRT